MRVRKHLKPCKAKSKLFELRAKLFGSVDTVRRLIEEQSRYEDAIVCAVHLTAEERRIVNLFRELIYRYTERCLVKTKSCTAA